MSLVLHPVDYVAGRSYKCAVRRLIVVHFLPHVDKMLVLPETQREPFKITQIITVYTAVKVIAEAWDMVPRRVVLKVWIKTFILSPHHVHDVEDLLVKHKENIDTTLKPQNGSATMTEEEANIIRPKSFSDLSMELLRLL